MMEVTAGIMAQERARKHQANGIEKAMFKRLSDNVFAKMRNVRQHHRFSIDPFDQRAYAFRHNGNMRPAVFANCHGPQMRATQVTRSRASKVISAYFSATSQMATGWPAFAGHDNSGGQLHAEETCKPCAEM
jgi:hypothetical protein